MIATREREAKFDVAEVFEVPAFDHVLDDSSVKLVASYWDTTDRRLLRWAHTLRYRQASDGTEDGWTLKLGSPGGSEEPGVLDRREVEAPGTSEGPPAELSALLIGLLRGAPLSPIATIETQRRTITLGGDREPEETLELSDDRVTSTIEGAPGPSFRQIEAETRPPGSAALLEDVHKRLVERGATRTASSKLERVLGGRFEPEILAQPLRPTSSVAALARFAIAKGLVRLRAQDPAVRWGDDDEAVHQARVATRRLRSDLKTLEPILRRDAVQRLRDELAWAGNLLGAVRDLDVLIARVQESATTLSPADRDASTALVTALRDERHRRHRELVEGFDSARYVNLVNALVEAARTPPLSVDSQKRAKPVLRKLVRRAWLRTDRAVAKLDDDPEDAQLHEIRKRTKRARYAAELGQGVFGQPSERFAKRLARLQDVLGELQDTVVAQERLRSLARSDSGMTRASSFVAGVLAGIEQDAGANARRRWPRAWKSARSRRLRRWLG
jgi:CHAD domain-containing protein